MVTDKGVLDQYVSVVGDSIVVDFSSHTFNDVNTDVYITLTATNEYPRTEGPKEFKTY